MKRIVKIEITALVLAFVALGVYFIPNYIQKEESQKASKIKTGNEVFIQKALEEFKANQGIRASKVAAIVMDELNQASTNPYNKDSKAYTFDKECKGCSTVETDDSLEMIILTTYNKKGDLITRTVIKPPSFVTYSSKEED